MTKRQSHREALRALLADGELHHMSECLRVGGYRYGGRLFELRNEERMNIETVKLGDDEFGYRWIREGQMVMGL